MKHLFFSLLSFFAFTVFADHQPMSFPEGKYLGSGEYVSNNGDEGTYASYAEITSNSWNIAHYRDDDLYLYGLFFNFNDYGFFDVELIDYSDDDQKTYYGHGYCWSLQCHIHAHLENSVFEQTITYLPWNHRIYWIGSITRKNGTEHEGSSISWEESMMRISPRNEAE